MSLYESKLNGIVLDRSRQAVFELGNKFVVAYCTGIKEEGYAPVKSVDNDIRYILLNDKKASRIISDMNSKVSGAGSIDEVSSLLGLTVQEATGIGFNSFSVPGAGIEPAVISTATTLGEGNISKPVKGNNGVFIIAVNSVTSNQQSQSDELLRSRLTTNYQMRAVYEAFESVREMSDIVDKRYKFY
ncbi:MAG: hypothetical protein R2744_05810 [Bacteroidales bacterium]